MTNVGYATLSIIPSFAGFASKLNTGVVAPMTATTSRAASSAGSAASRGFAAKFQSGIAGIGPKLIAGLGLAAVAKSVITMQGEFEASINTLGAAADLTTAQMRDMSEFAKQMGADTVFSASESADAMVELAKAGLSPAIIKAGALKGTMSVAATEGLNLADAATIMSNAMTTFKLEGGEAVDVADALAGGSKASTASVASLSEAMKQVGGSAVDAGLSLQETVGALAAFDQEGIKGSDAGTSLKTMLSRLVPQTDKAANAMDDLGLKFTDANGQFVPLADVAEQLRTKLGRLSDAERTSALNTIFGSDARRAAIALMHQGKRGIDEFTDATSESGTAQKLADARMKGTAGAIEKMRGSIENLGLEVGETLAPAVVQTADLVGGLADGFTKLPGPIKAATGAFAALKIAAAIGLEPPSLNQTRAAMDGLRSRTSAVADEYNRLRSASITARGAGFQFNQGAGRITAGLGAMQVAAKGAGGAMRRSIGGLTGVLGGPWGIAIIGATALVSKFFGAQQEAKAHVEEHTSALNQQTGALTQQNKQITINALQEEGMLQRAKDAGVSLGTVTQAAMGNSDALRSLKDESARLQTQIESQIATEGEADTMLVARRNNIDRLISGVQDESSAVGQARAAAELKTEADKESKSVTGQLISRTDLFTGAIQRAKTAVDNLIASEKQRALNAIQQRRDGIALRETFRAATDEAKKGKKVLDGNSKAADANMSALLDLAEQWANSKGKVTDAKGAYEDMRRKFIDVAEQMGASKERAKELADQLLKVPKTAPIRFQSEGYRERLAEIRELRRRAQELGNIEVDYTPRGFGAPGFATGGMIGGIGSRTSDSNLIYASRGEFMQPASSVDYYGPAFMEAIRRRLLPKPDGYARGGLVAAKASGGGGGGVAIQIGQVVAHDYNDFMRQAQRRSQQASLGGIGR